MSAQVNKKEISEYFLSKTYFSVMSPYDEPVDEIESFGFGNSKLPLSTDALLSILAAGHFL